jgi:cellulose synthase/poly-beta-1,6-N-acetylglucosamine synthase-like glycosyltransferase
MPPTDRKERLRNEPLLKKSQARICNCRLPKMTACNVFNPGHLLTMKAETMRLSTDGTPIVSIVIRCRNEKDQIGAVARSILAQDPPPGGFEVIVADGISEDGTRETLKGVPECDPYEAWGFLCAADIFVYASHREGMPKQDYVLAPALMNASGLEKKGRLV